MKTCTKCLTEKEDSQFSLKRGKPAAQCKACIANYFKTRYNADPTYKAIVLKAVKKQQVERTEYVTSQKHKPCTDCKVQYPPYVMEFDHLPGTKKLIELSAAGRWGWSHEKIDEEIAKCELVCSNCHKIRTWERNHIAGGVRSPKQAS